MSVMKRDERDSSGSPRLPAVDSGRLCAPTRLPTRRLGVVPGTLITTG
jgi:hypothetical protein